MAALLDSSVKNASLTLYALSLLCILYFFYKVLRHPNKSYGLLMILVLMCAHFVSAILEMILLLYPTRKDLDNIDDISIKFTGLWIICLAVCHYSVLKSFKGKYKQPHFKRYIFLGVIACLALSTLTNFEFFKSWRGDFAIVYGLVITCLGYISFKTYRFREEIQFGMYNFAKAPASKLIRFASIQFAFAIIYMFQDILERFVQCNPANPGMSQSIPCDILNLIWAVVYQCWILFTVLSNWDMFSISEVNENKENSGSFMSYSISMSKTSSLRTSDIPILA